MSETNALVFIHGLFGSLSDEALLMHYGKKKILAPDLLGYGKYRLHDVSSLSLIDQAEHVLTCMNKSDVYKANLIGHSVGGAVAALLAIRHPDRVNVLVSVEGNMTPPDAFWSAALVKKSINDIQEMVDSYRADVPGWIAGAGVSATSESIRIAKNWLDNQPAATLKAQASAVVDATSETSGFLELLREQLENGLELHLIAGSNSRDGWHVPVDIEAAAKTVTLIPDCGHLMMLQSPVKFVDTVLDVLK